MSDKDFISDIDLNRLQFLADAIVYAPSEAERFSKTIIENGELEGELAREVEQSLLRSASDTRRFVSTIAISSNASKADRVAAFMLCTSLTIVLPGRI
jgi:hypothetical protein